jgi:AcrR family transcriptional regulator
MPKLSREVLEEKRGRIEDAAKELFIKRGFHATSMRDVASGAGTSLGNLYNYYKTKEDILESIIARYQKVIDARLRAIFDEIEEPFDPASLARFGRMIKELVSTHSDFWLLMYIDVLEFENRHLLRDGIDPAVGFTAAYMQFFNYFLVEKLFGGNRHLGMSDDRVIATLTDIFVRGVMKPGKQKTAHAVRAK